MYEFPIKYKGAKEENVIENMAAFSMNELWVTTYLSQILRGQYAWGKKTLTLLSTYTLKYFLFHLRKSQFRNRPWLKGSPSY